ncbi:MAG: poly(A) polymerase, partial [Myxococcota bacterium]
CVFAWAEASATGEMPWEPEAAWVAQIRREAGRLIGADMADLCCALDRALTRPTMEEEFQFLAAVGVLGVLLPEVAALIGFHSGCSVHHKDLWEHTLKVTAKIPADPDLRWAALMHDAGKIGTRTVLGSKVSFLRHEALGAWLMQGVGTRLSMPADRIDRITFVIGHHGRINAYEPGWSDRAVTRLIRDAGLRLDDLLAFSSADYTTKRTSKAARITANLAHLRARIAALSAPSPWTPPQDLGDHLAETLNLARGPMLGDMIRWLREEVIDGRLPPEATVEACLEHVRTRVVA